MKQIVICIALMITTWANMVNAEESPIIKVSFIGNSDIAVVKESGELIVMDARTFSVRFKHKYNRIFKAAYLPANNQMLISFNRGSSNIFIDLKSGDKVGEINLSNRFFDFLTVDPSENLVAFGRFGNFTIVDRHSGQQQFSYDGDDIDSLTGISFTPSGKQFITMGHHIDLVLWNLQDKSKNKIIRKKTTSYDVVFDHQNKYAILARGTRGVLLYNVKDWKVARWFKEFSADAKYSHFLPSGKAAFGGVDETVRFWKVPSGKHYQTIRVRDLITSLALDSTSKKILIGTREGKVSLWNIEGKKLKEIL